MDDDYSHQDHALIYVSESVPGPTENTQDYNKIIEDFNSQIVNKCNCNSICEHLLCVCLIQSGGDNYTFSNSDNLLHLNENKLKNDIISPIIECNDLCSCDVNCGNRLVQKGPLKSLYVKQCENKGQGLFCNNFIKKGSFICEYAGEVITQSQAINRQQSNISNKDMNYVFCLNEHSKNTITQTFVDPSRFGNIGRYINHSCDPNCVIVPVRVNIPIPKLAIFSCVEISPHTEISFNYGSTNSSEVVPEYVDRKECFCGTAKCEGWMPFQMF